jgi:hypothetical protein
MVGPNPGPGHGGPTGIVHHPCECCHARGVDPLPRRRWCKIVSVDSWTGVRCVPPCTQIEHLIVFSNATQEEHTLPVDALLLNPGFNRAD